MDIWMEERMSLSPDIIDDKLMDASTAAIQTGRLTPLIKEELWTKIQARRLSEGKTEMTVDFKKPPSRTLSKEEEKKVEIRRERNRIAARKCRRKRKDTVDDMDKALEQENERNVKLKATVRNLEREKAELLQLYVAAHSGQQPSDIPASTSAQGRQLDFPALSAPASTSALGRQSDFPGLSAPANTTTGGSHKTSDLTPVTLPELYSAQSGQQTTDFRAVTPPACFSTQGRQQTTEFMTVTPPTCSSTPSPGPYMYFEQSSLHPKCEYTLSATPLKLEFDHDHDELQVVPVHLMMYPYNM